MDTICSEGEIPLFNLLPIMQRLVRLTDKHKQYGLTKSQIMVMMALGYQGSITMSEIAQYMSSSKEHATRVVATLYNQGLVERFELPDNRTHVFIRYTEKGQMLMQELEKQMYAEISKKLSDSLLPEERETLCKSLQTAVSILRKVN